VQRSRATVFAYCAQLPAGVYTAEFPGFGGSMRDLHLHAADCYLGWMGRFALGEDVPPAPSGDLAAVRERFAVVDALVDRFLARYAGEADRPVTGTVPWLTEPLTVTPRWLFAHAVTHEFHHKGQIVKLGRLLGYPVPLDTDLALPLEADAHRLAARTGTSPALAVQTAVAAALAHAVAPQVDGDELARRQAGETVWRWGVRFARAAAEEVARLPAAVEPDLQAAVRDLAADPEAGQRGEGGRRRYAFTALGSPWRVVYALGEDGQAVVLLVTTRERAVY
jgi:uncharacterized damage-inducible protein DinB